MSVQHPARKSASPQARRPAGSLACVVLDFDEAGHAASGAGSFLHPFAVERQPRRPAPFNPAAAFGGRDGGGTDTPEPPPPKAGLQATEPAGQRPKLVDVSSLMVDRRQPGYAKSTPLRRSLVTVPVLREKREWKRQWALRNPDKVREANARWRAAHPDKVRRQARLRMRRYRARRRIPAPATSSRNAATRFSSPGNYDREC